MRSPSSAPPARRVRALALAGVLAVVAGACGGSGDGSAAAPQETGAGAGTTLTIKDFAFSPAPLEVPVGTVVAVTNLDDAAHTATADDGAFDSGELAEGERKEITLSEVGEYRFHCTIHDYMEGVIRVTP